MQGFDVVFFITILSRSAASGDIPLGTLNH